MQQSAYLLSKVISGSTKVVDFGTNRNRVFDFLLVINSNLCRILHRFGYADRQTDRITITKTVQRIASHGTNTSNGTTHLYH